MTNDPRPSTCEYDRGYHDGERAALRLLLERICDPAASWNPKWGPEAYRIAALIASQYFGASVPVRGEIHPDFGRRQLSVDDFVYNPS